MPKVVSAIDLAITQGRLKEPFSALDFKVACPCFGEGTYRAFLWKHRLGNPGGYRPYFEQVSVGRFKRIRKMVTRTRDKLLEAKYFFERMKENQSEQDPFRYYLSAFLVAARSVTLFMQKEFSKVCGFQDWYAQKRTEMRNDEVMKVLDRKRTLTIHQEPVRPHSHVRVTVQEHIHISTRFSLVAIHANGSVERRESEPTPPPTPSEGKVMMQWRWYFDELPEKDIVALCQEHIVKLENLVADCESRFGSLI